MTPTNDQLRELAAKFYPKDPDAFYAVLLICLKRPATLEEQLPAFRMLRPRA